MKAQFLMSMYLGDTELNIHGDADQIEEIYIAGTDHEVSEMIYALNQEAFKKQFKEALYYSRTY
jgi:hypothetical protein